LKKQILAILLLATACVNNESSGREGETQTFNIAANTEACEGVAPMRCLVVNSEFFYDMIDDYQHVEGQPAKICVIRSARPEPIAADQGSFSYRRVDCE